MATQANPRKLPQIVFRILWLPMGGVLFFLLNSTGGMKALDAAVIAYPGCLIGQFSVVAAKYSCKSSPIEKTNPSRLFATHLLASQVIAVLWYSLARTIVLLASFAPQWKGIDGRFSGRGGIVYFAGTVSYLLAVGYYYVVFARENAMKAEGPGLGTTMLAREWGLKEAERHTDPFLFFQTPCTPT